MRAVFPIGLLVISLATAALAQEQPVTLADTEYREFTSKITGRSYGVFVAFPESYKTTPTRRYPVLYTTDSHIGFPLTAHIYRLMRLGNDVPEMLIVSLAGQNPNTWAAMRFMELTPTRVSSRDAELSKSIGQPVQTGEAASFLRVYTEELIPDVEKRYRTTQERMYSGHSLGALFGLFSLFQSPLTFQRMILVSPALYWDEQVMLKIEEKFAASKRPLKAEVYVAVGGLETQAMLDNTKRFIAAVAEHKHNGLTLHSITFESETHSSVFPGAFARGMRTLFPKQATK